MRSKRGDRPGSTRTHGPADRLRQAHGRVSFARAVTAPGAGAPAGFPVDSLRRAVNAEPVYGNRISLQFDGPYTFDSWIDAIGRAQRYVLFENYILRNDRTGRAFRDALIERAEAGVAVYVLYDWLGCWATPRRYWKAFRDAGVHVRAFNPPSVRDPLGVFQRDHRKLVCVDGSVAFVGGFCVGDEWAGEGSAPPWRDTGVEVLGPAALQLARTFSTIWGQAGGKLPVGLWPHEEPVAEEGEVPVWVIEGAPWRSRVYRETQLVAAAARDRIWITDPYFVAPRPVSEALAAAARDGVDVRILVPAHNNWPWVGSLSRGGYRALLKAGVRIFEWQGPMIHAKTAVADGIWSRIGSSNLNAASLLGNWEIDLGVLDRGLARQMEGLFLADLASSIEIVLPGRLPPGTPRRGQPEAGPSLGDPGGVSPLEIEGSLQERLELWRRGGGSTGWRLSDLVRAGSALGDAIAGHRPLGREDRTVLGTTAIATLVLGGMAAVFPRAVGWVIAVLLLWLGLALGIRAAAQARQARSGRLGASAERETRMEGPQNRE